MIDFNRLINSAVKSGKVFLGSKQALETAKSGKAAAIIVASNCPIKTFTNIKHHSELSNIPFYEYPASSLELGTALGKPFVVSALVIRETNDPTLLKLKQELNREIESES